MSARDAARRSARYFPQLSCGGKVFVHSPLGWWLLLASKFGRCIYPRVYNRQNSFIAREKIGKRNMINLATGYSHHFRRQRILRSVVIRDKKAAVSRYMRSRETTDYRLHTSLSRVFEVSNWSMMRVYGWKILITQLRHVLRKLVPVNAHTRDERRIFTLIIFI